MTTYSSRIFMLLLVLGVLTYFCHATEQPFKKVIHKTDPKAKCLDGSDPALYIHSGS